MGARYSVNDRLTVLENMGYEIEMLYGMQLLRSKLRGVVVEDIDLSLAVVWNTNALLEAHCVHVRTLLEFFFLGSTRIDAGDYVEDWANVHRPDAKSVLGEPAGPLYGDLNHRLSHLNTPRKDIRVWDTLPTITKGLLHTVRLFDTLLAHTESLVLRSKARDIGWGNVDRCDIGT